MFDRRYSRAGSDLDAFGAMRVSSNFASQFACLVNHRFQLFKRVLRNANRCAPFGEHPGGRARLDNLGAVLDLISNRRAHLIWTIRNAIFNTRIKHSRAISVVVAMSATNPERMSRGNDPGTLGPTVVDRLAQREVVKSPVGSKVSHRRKTRHQRSARVLYAENCTERCVVSHECVLTGGIAEHAPDEMRMHVDEARH